MGKKVPFFILFFLFFCFNAAKAQIDFGEVYAPRSSGLTNDTVAVSVRIVLTYSVVEMTAEVNGRKISLLRNESLPHTWGGTMILTGLPQGPLQMDFFVKDAMGNTKTLSQMFIHDSLPKVTVLSPLLGSSSQQPTVRIKAIASDPGNTESFVDVSSPQFSFQFKNEIDTIVPVSGPNVLIKFLPRDNKGQLGHANSKTIRYWVAVNPYLTTTLNGDGEVLDFVNRNALVLKNKDGYAELSIVNTETGVVEQINLGAPVLVKDFGAARLCLGGATFTFNTGVSNYDLYIWKNGTLINLSNLLGVNCRNSPLIQGQYMTWIGSKQASPVLYLTDLQSLNSTLIESAGSIQGGVLTGKGTLVYSKGDQSYEYNLTTKTKVTYPSHYASLPVYDGINSVYKVKVSSTKWDIHFNNGTTDSIIGQSLTPSSVFFINGYLMFSKVDVAGVEQVWVRSPDNTYKQHSFFANSSEIENVTSTGGIIFTSLYQYYYVDNVTAAMKLENHVGVIASDGNSFYSIIGGSIYKYNFPTPTSVKIKSFSPTSAAKGATITIIGSNFTDATQILFGGTIAQSYHIVSDTVITATVGDGSSGAVSVYGQGGQGSKEGFVFLPPPVVLSLSKTIGATGASIVITGANFTGATAVTFGGMPAASFVVNSATSITAVVGEEAGGNVVVTTPSGSGSFAGFTILPVPVIATNGPTDVFSRDIVSLYITAPNPSYAYQWLKNGLPISRANFSTYDTNQAGSYSLRITVNGVSQTSQSIPITVNFVLPPDNFKLTNTGVTCKGAANGILRIEATKSLFYTATITSPTNVTTSTGFNTSLYKNFLTAGSYQICITLAEEPTFKQCFTAVITEPKDLSLYSSVIKATNQVVLSLTGADTYYVNLNGETTTNTTGQLILPLKKGLNKVSVSSDKACQGTVVRDILLEGDISVFPNPFANEVWLSIGENPVKKTTIRVYDTINKLVFSKDHVNMSGTIPIDLTQLQKGIYILRVTLDDKITTQKIVKN